MLERIDESLFDWLTWRAGNIYDLGVPLCREYYILQFSYLIKECAIGYCPGEKLLCRPKKNEVGVMCLKNEKLFWFHLRRKEFEKIFGEING